MVTGVGRLAAVLALVLPLGCGGSGAGGGSADSITLYTCVGDDTVQAVIGGFEDTHPGVQVDLFRAPTSDLNARVAADVRSGGLRADVVWACDPLTMRTLVDQKLVGGWTPDGARALAERYRTPDYVGVAVLYIVAAYHDGAPVPRSWSDLAGPEYADAVALPDPAVAASALGALGYFSNADGYGLDYYRRLHDNGAVQVSTPDDAVSGVASGTYQAVMTIANSAYLAADNGSPIGVSWPEPGAVGVYGPIALARSSTDSSLTKQFISYVVSRPGQTTLANAGSYPTLAGVPGPTIPAGAPIVYPDWSRIASDQDQLLRDYQQIFGG